MAEDLLDRVRREIRERRLHAQAASEESRQLEAALRALDGAQPQPTPPVRRERSAPGPRRPRGQTREAILRVISERPGVSAGEIAAVAGVGRAAAQTSLGRLVRQQAIERFAPPGGGSAYRPATPRDPDATPPEGAGETLDDDAPEAAVAETADADSEPSEAD